MTDAEYPSPAVDAAVVGDLLVRERRESGPALVFPDTDPDRSYSYRDCCTTAWKAGNFLRYLGVRGGREMSEVDDPGGLVAVAPDRLPEPVLTFLGAALLGAATRFDPRGDGSARVTVVHADDAEAFDPPGGTKLVVYGGEPSRPGVERWEEQVWSENPRVHPATVDPDDTALVADGRYTHGDLLGAGRRVTERLDLSPGDCVAVRADLADPRAVAAGVVAPLLAGATAVFPDEARGDVVAGDGSERTTLSLDDVAL